MQYLKIGRVQVVPDWRITLLLVVWMFSAVTPGHAAEALSDDTFFPFSDSSGQDETGQEEWRELQERLNTIEAGVEGTEAEDEQQLLLWQKEVSALEEAVAVYIESLQGRLTQLNSRLETLGMPAEDEQEAIAKQRDEIKERKSLIDARLAAYRLLQLQSRELYQQLDVKRQQVLTAKFFSRGQDSFTLLRQHSDLAWRWVGESYRYLVGQSGFQLLDAKALLKLSAMLAIAVGLGLLFRRKCYLWCGDHKDETYRHTRMVLAAFGHFSAYLFSAIAAALFVRFVLDAPTGTLLYQLGATLPLLVALWALVHFLFRGNGPVAPLFKLSKGVGKGLARSLKLLLFLAFIGGVVSAGGIQAMMSDAAELLSRDLFVVIVVFNLFWLARYLQRLLRKHEIRGVYGVVVLLLAASLVIELSGYRNISYWVLRILLGSSLVIFVAWLVVLLVNEFFVGLRSGRLWWQQGMRRLLGYGPDESMPWLGWINMLAAMVIWLAAAYGILLIWGLSSETLEHLSGYILEGFQIGELTILPLRVVIAIAVFAVLLALTGWFRRKMESVWLVQSRLERGTREALVTISGYIGIALAVLIALGVAGVKFTNLAIIAGALSLGIGFGLQNIVNNFVSGLILLFERPVKTGDWILVGNTEGYVKRISIRSTLIQTFDRSDVIVPNSELVSGQVTNWMLYDPRGRVRVPVGVAYGSDTEKVRDVLLKIAVEHPSVISDGSMPEPKVLFLAFGESSLNFELRAFIQNIDERLQVLSDFNFAIDAAFREAGIEIPFPQRDIHVRDWRPPPEPSGSADNA
ncbi:MAG: mechanosensitive ion channel [Pseudomonadota bacterium]